MTIFSKFNHSEIHPDDLRARIDAIIRRAIREAKQPSKRRKAPPPTPREVEQDLFVAWLAEQPNMSGWLDWLRYDVIDYAADQGGPEFLIQFGKALQLGKSYRSRWFSEVGIFILENWRKGYNLRSVSDEEAVKILNKAGKTLSVTAYKDQTKGLQRRSATS